jgi:hypothetical protein
MSPNTPVERSLDSPKAIYRAEAAGPIVIDRTQGR